MKALSDNVLVILPALAPVTVTGIYNFKGSYDNVAKHAHVHNSHGQCLKRRYGNRCH